MEENRPAPLSTRSSHPRLAAEGVEARIRTTVFCARCGYNLKGHPYVARCVECNSPYNARRVLGLNIHRPGTAEFPTRALLSLLILVPVVIAFGYAWYAGSWLVRLPLTVAVPIVVVTAGYLTIVAGIHFIRDVSPYRRFKRFEAMHADSIAQDAELEVPSAEPSSAQPAPAGPKGDLSLETRQHLEDMGYQATIDWSVLCSTCGYNLRGLRYLGTCPECGSEYNARPGQMRGAMSPHGALLPWSNIWSAVACAVIAFLLIQSMMNEFYVATLVMTVLFVAGTIAFALIAWRRSRSYSFARKALRQMEDEEEDA